MAQIFRRNPNSPWKVEELDDMLRRFKRKVIEERIVATCRERGSYMKPSEKRRAYEKEIKAKVRKANSRREADITKDI
jgi:ribosomal protein S21